MKKYRKSLSWLLVLLLFATLSGCGVNSPGRIKAELSRTRPRASYLWPKFTGEITDLRFTVVERKIDQSILAGDFTDCTYMQIYYGYQMDGKWVDMPCENYDLKRFGNKDPEMMGYELDADDHVVLIGPYLVIAIGSTDSWSDITCEITDTLNTEVIEKFSEYYTSYSIAAPDGKRYGHLIEYAHTARSSQGLDYTMSPLFYKWHYLVLDYETLPEDYVVTIRETTETKTREYRYTYADIQETLNK